MSSKRSDTDRPDDSTPRIRGRTVFPTASAALAAAWAAAINGPGTQTDADGDGDGDKSSSEPRARTALITRTA